MLRRVNHQYFSPGLSPGFQGFHAPPGASKEARLGRTTVAPDSTEQSYKLVEGARERGAICSRPKQVRCRVSLGPTGPKGRCMNSTLARHHRLIHAERCPTHPGRQVEGRQEGGVTKRQLCLSLEAWKGKRPLPSATSPNAN